MKANRLVWLLDQRTGFPGKHLTENFLNFGWICCTWPCRSLHFGRKFMLLYLVFTLILKTERWNWLSKNCSRKHSYRKEKADKNIGFWRTQAGITGTLWGGELAGQLKEKPAVGWWWPGRLNTWGQFFRQSLCFYQEQIKLCEPCIVLQAVRSCLDASALCGQARRVGSHKSKVQM